MSDDAERIRQQMQHLRQEMGAGVQDVVHGVRQLSDWRYYVRKHPWACLGSAFTLGFMATPARKKLFTGASNLDVASLVQQLKGAADVGGAPAAGGMAGKIIAMVGPFVLQNAAAMVAQRFAQADHAKSTDAASPPVDAP